MPGLPPKYAMQSRPAGQLQSAAAGSVALPVDVQLGLLRQQVERLAAELAELRAQMEAECVRQYWTGEVHFPASTQITIAGNGNELRFDPAGIRIASAGRLTLEASVIGMPAGAVNIDAGMTKASGVIQCETIQANSVVGASYTPGAGNVW